MMAGEEKLVLTGVARFVIPSQTKLVIIIRSSIGKSLHDSTALSS